MTNGTGANTTDTPAATQTTMSPDATTLDGNHETTTEFRTNIVNLGNNASERDNTIAIAIGVILLTLVMVLAVLAVVVAFRMKMFGRLKRNGE